MLDDVFVMASLHEERVSHHRFGVAGLRSVFTLGRVVIENDDGAGGTVVQALDQPRASFVGHTLQTPWTTPQLAYFAGTAMWTYLTQPLRSPCQGSKLLSWSRGRKTASSGAVCA